MHDHVNRRLLFPLALFAAVVGFFVWNAGDERAIERALAEIQRTTAKAPGESDLTGLSKAKKIAERFHQPFVVHGDEVGFSTNDRRELIGSIHRFRSRSSASVMQVGEHRITVNQPGQRATSYLTVEFLAGLDDLGGSERYETRIQWRKAGRRWLIATVEVLDVR